MTKHATIIICGAGIAGIATAYYLSVKYGVSDILLVDERPPLSLTSDKSTEAYRNWWPGPDRAMVAFMDHSIDLLEDLARQTNNAFLLNRRGYLYATASPKQVEIFKQMAENAAELGAGPVRYHTGSGDKTSYTPASAEGFENQPTGADLITDPTLIKTHFPYLTEKTNAVLHTRRCGWFSGQQLGMLMLRAAQAHGVQLIEGRIEAVTVEGEQVTGVTIRQGERIETASTNIFVNAAGPFVAEVGHMMGLDLPVFSERHLKVNFKDHLGVIPRNAPMTIWADPQTLPWSAEEKEMLAEDDETHWLTATFPAGVHMRPEGPAGSPIVLMLWDYHQDQVEPIVPLPDDPDFPEVVLRGLTTVIPDLAVYLERMPKPIIDGGYYTKTPENRPLIGPLPLKGAYINAALSGFGLMAAPAAGDLLGAYLTNSPLPDYAPAFHLNRYEEPAYQTKLANWGETGQL